MDAALITAATKSADPLELAAKLLRDRGRISVIGDVGMGVSRANMYRKEISLSMSRSYGPGRYDPQYEEGGQDYPIGFVRWTEKRNMEAFLDLLSAGALQIEPLLAHRFAVEEGGKAYAAVEAGAYTGIIDYHAPGDGLLAALPARSPQPRPIDKLRAGCIGAGGFARGVIFPLLRSSAGLVLESVATGTGAAAASARTGFGFAIAESPSSLLTTPMSMPSSFLRATTAIAPMSRALSSAVRAYLSKSHWRLMVSSWRWYEEPTRKCWQKTDRLFSWWASIAASHRLRKS